MRAYYFIIISVVLVVLGMLFYPSLHLIIDATPTAGFLPLLSAGTAMLPYAFLAFVVYAIFTMIRR